MERNPRNLEHSTESHYTFFDGKDGIESIFSPDDWLGKSLNGMISEVICYYLLPRAESKWLADGHPAGFLLKVGLELTISWFLVLCLNHYTKLALIILQYFEPSVLKF